MSDAQSEFVKKFHLDEDEINTLEGDTKEQANSQLLVSERKYRFTASNFHLITHRQRHHENFANTLMHPKPFTSRHTRHGIKYEPEGVHAYMKYMNNRSIPVEIFKSGLVVYKREPVLACSLDGKVIDAGCSKQFGLLEVKCPETKFLVSPLDACSDPSFCCENIDGKCKLKVAHPYDAQVQGQMGITGADWCESVIFTKKGMSIEGVPFDPEYWQELKEKLLFYYYTHFIKYAITDAL